MNHRNPNPAYFDALAKARGVQLPQARSWAILLTSANHGVVGPVGSQFPHAGEKHERVLVVEVPAAAGAPSDQVNLVLRAAAAAPVAAQAGQVAVPEGWKLVPIEPTEAMMDRAEECDHEFHRASWSRIWPAMLAAAPAAPAQAKPLPAAQAYLAAELDPAEPVCRVSDLKSAQASTAGGRQEGGA